ENESKNSSRKLENEQDPKGNRGPALGAFEGSAQAGAPGNRGPELRQSGRRQIHSGGIRDTGGRTEHAPGAKRGLYRRGFRTDVVGHRGGYRYTGAFREKVAFWGNR